MTTQEYIQKEAKKIVTKYEPVMLLPETWVEQGLSAGIELAKAFAEWVSIRASILSGSEWEYHESKRNYVEKTTSELFEIFLTERNEK